MPNPYRDISDLSDIRENIKQIANRLDELEKSATSPLSEAIAKKIKAFNLAEFVIGLVIFAMVVVTIGYLSFMLYKRTTVEPIISHCNFDFDLSQSFSSKHSIRVIAVIEWHEDPQWGPFSSLEEAKSYAKLNGCPNVE